MSSVSSLCSKLVNNNNCIPSRKKKEKNEAHKKKRVLRDMCSLLFLYTELEREQNYVKPAIYTVVVIQSGKKVITVSYIKSNGTEYW